MTEVSWFVGNFKVMDGPTSGEGLLSASFHGRKEGGIKVRDKRWPSSSLQ